MYEENIKELNKWFDHADRCFNTGYNDIGEYCVSQYDIDDLTNFLREKEPDLIGIPCMIGAGGIWFTREDLEKARYL